MGVGTGFEEMRLRVEADEVGGVGGGGTKERGTKSIYACAALKERGR